ncbi:MAG: trigger factor [Leptolyngbyaceae cyanobacterium SL_7_1]|nr:trigger factor [Leptolyngbyaceae cyanobacterium SL_7_1]
MKITQEKLPASQIGLEIEITPEMSREAYEKALREFVRNVNIPGFRKGKVPRQILIQRIGTSRIKAAALEDLMESTLKQAVEQEKINAIGSFELRSPFEDLIQQFEPGAALTFSAAVDVPPEITLNQYKDLHVQAEEIAFDPAKVDETIEEYRDRAATLVPVEGRAAQAKDIATVDFAGQIVPENETDEPMEIPGGSAEDFEIELSEGKFIPGFIDGIIGMNLGETKQVHATFPENYMQEDLSAKPAIFTVTLKELKEKELPELDDDFAEDVSEFETLEEFRASIEARFKEEAEQRTRSNKETALLNELVKHIEVELPETLIKQEVNYLVTQTAMQFSRQGIDIKQFLTDELVARMRDRARPEAIARLQRTLALGKIAELESIKSDPEAVNAKVKEFQQNYQEGEVDLQRLRELVEEDVVKEKIFDWLIDNATIELVPEGTLQTEELEDEELEDEEFTEEDSDAESLSDPVSEEIDAVATVEAVVEIEEDEDEEDEDEDDEDAAVAIDESEEESEVSAVEDAAIEEPKATSKSKKKGESKSSKD